MHNLGHAYLDVGRLTEAEKLLEEVLRRQKAKLGPDHPQTLTSMDYLARVYHAAGRRAEHDPALSTEQRRKEMHAYYAKAHDCLTEVAHLSPQDPRRTYSLAWFLVNCPDATYRNPKRAVELAKQAVTWAPQDGTAWYWLGITAYRAGHWKEAITALDKAMELLKQSDGSDRLFLAMAYWQLGDKQKARQWYDQAAAWMEKNKSPSVVRDLRSEAAALLGIQEQHTKDKETPTKKK